MWWMTWLDTGSVGGVYTSDDSWPGADIESADWGA